MKVLAIEPFHGGSHRRFLDGLATRSRHEVHLLTQPARFWKWRMRGSAVTLAQRAGEHDPDVILASDMLSVAEFSALDGRGVPVVLYMHENQLVYPGVESDARDVHFGFTNLTSCLAARRVAWNSTYHMESFLEAAGDLVRSMPDERPVDAVERIRTRSVVIPPGMDLEEIDVVPLERDGGPPIVLWNHRWEHDKRPELFFGAMERLAGRGADFRVAVVGESFTERPAVFRDARQGLGERLVQLGYVRDRDAYVRWLRRSSVSVSTADQENFGMAAVEAAYAGASPLWPDRLSYPELLGRGDHLYPDMDGLVDRLEHRVRGADDPQARERIAEGLRRFSWDELIGRHDDLLEEASGA